MLCIYMAAEASQLQRVCCNMYIALNMSHLRVVHKHFVKQLRPCSSSGRLCCRLLGCCLCCLSWLVLQRGVGQHISTDTLTQLIQ